MRKEGAQLLMERGIPTNIKPYIKPTAKKNKSTEKCWFVTPSEWCNETFKLDNEPADQSIHGLTQYQCFLVKQLVLQEDFHMKRESGTEQWWLPGILNSRFRASSTPLATDEEMDTSS